MERVRLDSAPQECAHTETELVGYQQDTVFLRCPSCGAVLVRQGTRTWKVPKAK